MKNKKVRIFGTLTGTTDLPFLSNVSSYTDTSFNVMFMYLKNGSDIVSLSSDLHRLEKSFKILTLNQT